MKKLILNVSCIDASYNDTPDHFIIELNAQQIEHIKKLSSIVKEQEALSIRTLDFSGEYFSSLTLDSFNGSHVVEDLTETAIEKSNDDSGLVEMPCLVVSENEFEFTCIPKHCGDSEACRTDSVAIKELDTHSTYCAVTL
ncbi:MULTISPECIES: hypothetical protein [Vibrio]|uniref:hypothetical protein n=1 Tax=Vibrio TaxID=662 RepID=UPI00207643B2|nr:MULTISPECIES: hypothetical protein [Vibrio]USD35631.1 hypothetical protein J8Z27_22750 [Vibrio sp. SCSIO 43186]USD72755.1 hypothetical protein J4N41_22755 [Vibrio sp. SCSIO 43139]USD98960.1 hypothetical protein CTT30_23080 [Vibrio coralliilyticus]